MIKDDLDWKIIELLQLNSRLSYAFIGRKIGLSASAVAERVQRLEDTDVIKGYSVVINPKKVGLPLSAYISISLNSNNFSTFLNSLCEFPEVVQCSRVTGNDCLIMKCNLMDSAHLETVIDRLAKFGNPTTLVVLSDIIINGKIKKSMLTPCSEEPKQVDFAAFKSQF